MVLVFFKILQKKKCTFSSTDSKGTKYIYSGNLNDLGWLELAVAWACHDSISRAGTAFVRRTFTFLAFVRTEWCADIINKIQAGVYWWGLGGPNIVDGVDAVIGNNTSKIAIIGTVDLYSCAVS